MTDHANGVIDEWLSPGIGGMTLWSTDTQCALRPKIHRARRGEQRDNIDDGVTPVQRQSEERRDKRRENKEERENKANRFRHKTRLSTLADRPHSPSNAVQNLVPPLPACHRHTVRWIVRTAGSWDSSPVLTLDWLTGM